jgi:predicted nucleotidyltransferase component of viral defense system
MLHLDDEEAVAREFGVSTAQVRRDHLISHLLAALSNHLQDKILFIGGTALSRSHIPTAGCRRTPTS